MHHSPFPSSTHGPLNPEYIDDLWYLVHEKIISDPDCIRRTYGLIIEAGAIYPKNDHIQELATESRLRLDRLKNAV